MSAPLQAAELAARNEVTAALGERFASRLRTLGEAVADVLEHHGVERIYGVGGDYVAPLLGAIENRFDVRPGANELHAAYAACASAELGKLGVCLVTYTVGSLPTVSAAALALTEGLPVVFLSGAPGECEVSSPSWLHHMVAPPNAWAVDPSAALRSFRALGMRAERLQGKRGTGQASIAGEMFRDLVQYALDRSEPVFIEVPRDLVPQLVQPFSLRPTRPDDPEHEADADAIAEHVVEELRKSRKPVILLGERMRHHPRIRSLVGQLIENFQIPYATNAFAKGVLDEAHPLALGVYNGAFGARRARAFIEQEADYVLELCTSVVAQETSTAFGTGTYAPARGSRHTVLRGSSPTAHDVELVLERVLRAKLARFDTGLQVRPHADDLPNDTTLGFHVLARALDQCQDESSVPFVYLPEVGNSFFTSFGLTTRASALGRGWLTNPWYAAMGSALPYAREVGHALRDIGAPDMPVVLIGDGGFHFQSSELVRLQADGLSVLVVLLRNNVFHLGKMSDGSIYRSSSEAFDAGALATAYGATYRLACTVGELRAAFASALSDRSRSHLVEVPVPTSEETQSDELRLLNLYIRARGGDPEARTRWQGIADGGESSDS